MTKKTQKPHVVIVTPALPSAGNGNGQTSFRYQKLLSEWFDVRLCTAWEGVRPGEKKPVAMIAIHAKKSAESIQAWSEYKQQANCVEGLIVVLAGTDLYVDLPESQVALRSLQKARFLIGLQELAECVLPKNYKNKLKIVFQSVQISNTLLIKRSERKKQTKSTFRVMMVGHLRQVKDPHTFMRAAQLLRAEKNIEWFHLGACLDDTYLPLIEETSQINPNYRWLGQLSHELTLEKMAVTDLIVHCSESEGSSHAIVEAICLGLPIIASRVDGNVGTLGMRYSGYFELKNCRQLADLIQNLYTQWLEQTKKSFYVELEQQVNERQAVFDSVKEQACLLDVVNQAQIT